MELIQQLKTVLLFQGRFKETHVGGSIGLFLHGIDLKRSLSKSDIDMISKISIDFTEPLGIENAEESSNPEDFDAQYRFYPDATGNYIKIDIKIRPEKDFDIINFEGIEYRVSKLEDILFWKQKYADKGVEKHIYDMIVINGGERPAPKEPEPATDDLPF